MSARLSLFWNVVAALVGLALFWSARRKLRGTPSLGRLMAHPWDTAPGRKS